MWLLRHHYRLKTACILPVEHILLDALVCNIVKLWLFLPWTDDLIAVFFALLSESRNKRHDLVKRSNAGSNNNKKVSFIDSKR